MGNSSVSIQSCLDFCQGFPDLNSVVPASGYSVKRVLQVANATLQKFLSSQMKWAFNRQTLPVGITNSWQQDYATNLVNVAFLQDGTLLEINNTANPRPIWPLEVVQNLPATSQQYGRPGQIQVSLNRDLQYATWGASGIGTAGVTSNPQPNQTIINPIGQNITPANPILQVRDPNGNLWILTTFGTTGAVQPSWVASPTYPSFSSPNTAASTTADGTCVWTAVNPNNFGFRLSPLPPQTGVPYQIWPVWQMRPVTFTSLGQTIDPIPDDFSQFFMDGMVAHLYQQVTSPTLRAKHIDAVGVWMGSLRSAKEAMDRTRDSAVMFPSQSIMDGSDYLYYPSAARPYF